MNRSSAFRLPGLLSAVFVFSSYTVSAWAEPDAPEKPAGRFLYAGDDDWDWASPQGAAEPSELSRYGSMPWSALDWAEEGLEKVHGVLVGAPPKYLTVDGLAKLRGEHADYQHLEQSDENMLDLLASKRPPNVIILMQNSGKGGIFGEDAVDALDAFVKRGGRLLVLDDWSHHIPVYEKILGSALAPPNPTAPPVEIPREELERRVTGLVDDLGDGDFIGREKAMAKLRDLGIPAVEFAEELAAADPEVVARLAQLRSELVPSWKGQESHAEIAKRVTDSAVQT